MKSRTDSPDPPDLTGYEVLVAVCGGIAAYKVGEVVSRLVQSGAGVTVAMTRAARKFVGPVTFQALTARPVLTNMWHDVDAVEVRHVAVTEAADLMLVAPATANIIGKIASGIADDLVSTLAVSAASPVVLAPAMNERMWGNPIVQRNVTTLTDLGYVLIGPREGWLACGGVGPGRMAQPEEILGEIVPKLTARPAKALAKEE